MIAADRLRLVNTYRPPTIKAIKGDPSSWIEFMEHLIPDQGDRLETLRWCATLIAGPDVWMLYECYSFRRSRASARAPLEEMMSAPLYVLETSTTMRAASSKSNFNDWIVRKRLAIVHEIYAGHNWKAYDKLKSTITDKKLRVNEKYLPPFDLEIWVHIFACSNSLEASQDRRGRQALAGAAGNQPGQASNILG